MSGEYVNAVNEIWRRDLEAIYDRETKAILRSAAAHLQDVPTVMVWESCPENIGNDPCDDWSAEDQDWFLEGWED